MRPVLALLLTTLFLGGTFAYTRFAASVHHTAVEYVAEFSDGIYSFEIRKTFAATVDPIFGTESLSVKFKGETIFARSDNIPADEVIEIRPLDGVEVGENEILITANLESNNAALAVMQIEIQRDGIPVISKTIASQPGLPVITGTVVFAAKKKSAGDAAHDH